MTDREKAIVMAYTDVCTLQGDKLSVFYDYVAEIMGSRMDTLQMAMLAKEIKRKAEPDFIKLCEDTTDKNVGGKWISVNDRIPEQDVYVLCYYTDFGKHQYQTVGKLWSANGKWDLDIDSEYDIEDEKVVTHWMPLPEPPEEAENANR